MVPDADLGNDLGVGLDGLGSSSYSKPFSLSTVVQNNKQRNEIETLRYVTL